MSFVQRKEGRKVKVEVVEVVEVDDVVEVVEVVKVVKVVEHCLQNRELLMACSTAKTTKADMVEFNIVNDRNI